MNRNVPCAVASVSPMRLVLRAGMTRSARSFSTGTAASSAGEVVWTSMSTSWRGPPSIGGMSTASKTVAQATSSSSVRFCASARHWASTCSRRALLRTKGARPGGSTLAQAYRYPRGEGVVKLIGGIPSGMVILSFDRPISCPPPGGVNAPPGCGNR
ncbi:hypothetical protein [Nonomuraea sp. NPDC050202]|uniref:hypothetical protein n=1 Tax=Nonomuraea sp. NPDC050202 TaxID=3155035 RepID=UPI00340FAD6A